MNSEYFNFKVYQCPICKGTDVSIDMHKKMVCLNPKCKYNGEQKNTDGETLLKPFKKIEEQERKNLDPMQYFERRETKEKESDVPPHNII
jgi:hypothetical protein